MSVVRKIVPVALLLSAMTVQIACADTYFDHGRMLFDKRQYNQALPYFHKAAEDSPWDSTSAYYEALCYHQMRDWAHAKACYKGIVEHFPGSPAYSNAMSALRQLDPVYVRQVEQGTPAPTASASSSAGTDSSADTNALLAKVVVTAPSSEQRIPVVRQTSKCWLDVSIGGQTMKMDFNEGSSTTISPKDAKRMNLNVANGKALTTVKVGQISESGFPVTVEETSEPKLGGDFFNQFSYRLEPSALIASKKASGSSGDSSWDLPFTRKGNDMVVSFRCNGRQVRAILDTEGGECIVPRSRAKEFGLDVSDSQVMQGYYGPGTDPNGPLRGQPGFGEIKQLSTAEGKVIIGPSNTSVRFKIDDKAPEARITPSVFGSYKYHVDRQANKLTFTH